MNMTRQTNGTNGTNGVHLIQLPKRKQYGKFHVLSKGLEDGSNPTRVSYELSLEGVDEGRNVLCRRQSQCVTHAASEGWTSFDCRSCRVSEKLTVEEWQADLEGLAMLLASLNLMSLQHHR